MSATGTDWAVDRIVSVTDGDTVRLVRSRVLGELDDVEVLARDKHPRGAAIRLVTLDTPERGEAGYAQAAVDVETWLDTHAGQLRVETWPGGGFDRLLGDIYVTGYRSNTLSQWMLRERGWLPYVKGQ